MTAQIVKLILPQRHYQSTNDNKVIVQHSETLSKLTVNLTKLGTVSHNKCTIKYTRLSNSLYLLP